MFSGIVRNLGKIIEITDSAGGKLFKIEVVFAKELAVGDSVAIDGCCLTVIRMDQNCFEVEAVRETLELSIANGYEVGEKVNLERAMRFSDRLDGHLVSGHIDFKTKLLSIAPDGNSHVLTFAMPISFARYIALKGSVTLNGVSLTISGLNEASFEVTIIPHTYAQTNLELLKPDDFVNVEIDLMARYIERLLVDKEAETRYMYLQERGLI